MEELSYYDDPRVVEKWSGYADSGLHQIEEDLITEYFTDRGGDVLDLGCGTGRTTAPLAAKGYDVVGVDLSSSLIEQARQTHPDVEFRVGDATELAYPADSFQYVLFSGCGIGDIPAKADRMRALLEVRRVLEPGGVFAFDFHNIVGRFHFDPLSRDDWAQKARFVRRNLRNGSLTSRYALIEFPNGVDRTHAIFPTAQRRQLTDIGFDVLALRPRAEFPGPAYLDSRPFFVVRKPPEDER